MFDFEKLKKRWILEAEQQADRAKFYKRRLLERGIPIFKKYGVKEVYLFGSVAEGRCGVDADVDLYVSPLPNHRYWKFRFELEESVQLPVDLYTDHDDNVFIKKIMNLSEKIYAV